MKKPSLSMLLTGLCLTLSPLAFAASATKPLDAKPFSSKDFPMAFPTSEEWRKTDSSLFSAVRANAPHNWAYFRAIKPQLIYLKEVFEVDGIGIGDFHILNVGDIQLANGHRKIGLIDLDDGGRTSLFADFTRFAISNQVSPYKVPLRDLWKNYISGLKNKKIDIPEMVGLALEKTPEEYLELQESYLRKNIDGVKFSEAAEILPITEADAVTADVFNQSISTILKLLEGAKILDQGFKVKDSGGSQGVPRFWFLIESKGKKTIVEFKTLAEPAMSLYAKQESHEKRIQSLMENYRPKNETLGVYKFVDAGKYQFIVRARERIFIKLDPVGKVSDKEVRNGREISLYLAQKAGQWHADQGQGRVLSEHLTQQEDKKFQEFEKLVNAYIEVMKAENK